MLYLSTTDGVYRIGPSSGSAEALGPGGRSTEALAVNGQDIVAAPTPPYGRPMRDPLLPASDGGLVVSHGGGRTWEETGGGLGSPHVSALAATPVDAGVFFAGTDPADVYVSRDGGRTWQATMPLRRVPGYERWSYPLPPGTPHVMWFAPHPQQAAVVYAGIEVGGLLRTTDYGETWVRIGEGLHDDIHGLSVCRSQPDVLYAATPQGVYVSRDAALHWQRRSEGLAPVYCRPVAAHPSDPDVAFTVVTHRASGFFGIEPAETGTRVFRTRDGGASWQRLAGGLPEILPSAPALAIDSARPDTVYLGDFGGHLWASHNLGDRWETLTSDLPPILRLVVA